MKHVKFKNFLESLKTSNNKDTVDVILEGYENIRSINDLTTEEREYNRNQRESDKQELIPIVVTHEDLHPELKRKKRKKIVRKYPHLWADAIAKVGKGQGIGKNGWMYVQAEYKRLTKGLA
jgi:hypothetical protein